MTDLNTPAAVAVFRSGEHIVVTLPFTDGYSQGRPMRVVMTPAQAMELAALLRDAPDGSEK